MKRKCNPRHHHSKHCMCDGTQELPNILTSWFIRDGIEHRLVNVCLSKFSDGTAKWYVYFKIPGAVRGIYKVRGTRMGVGAWRYNVYANRPDLFPEGLTH